MKEKENFGWCDYHEENINECTYEWKGCWGCHYFIAGQNFPYFFVDELAKKSKVTPQTIRRWVKTGKLKGRIFRQGRLTGSFPSSPTYHIEKG